jgi:hypothetical protein
MERLESSDLGRTVLGAFIIVLLISLVAYATPDSAPKRALLRPGLPLLSATGLGQGWGMFAPEPRQQQIDLRLSVRDADGRLSTWRIPARGALLGASSDYRWRKWLEWQFMPGADAVSPTVDYVVRRQRAAGRHPVRVTVVRRLAQLPPPGDDAPPRWRTIRSTFRVRGRR